MADLPLNQYDASKIPPEFDMGFMRTFKGQLEGHVFPVDKLPLIMDEFAREWLNGIGYSLNEDGIYVPCGKATSGMTYRPFSRNIRAGVLHDGKEKTNFGRFFQQHQSSGSVMVLKHRKLPEYIVGFADNANESGLTPGRSKVVLGNLETRL